MSHYGYFSAVRTYYEPSYRLEPNAKLPIAKIRTMIERELEDFFPGLEYSILEASNWVRVLTDRLKSLTRDLIQSCGERYKVITMVTITQRHQQAMQISSQCMWEKEYDTVVSHEYKSPSMHAIGTVFCVYTP